MLPLLLTLLTIVPPADPVLRDECSRLERQHVYDGEGRLTFTQYIFWGADGHVIDWRMAKENMDLSREGKTWVLRWSENQGLREVRASSFDEQWGQVDSELIDRETWPKESRRNLRAERG